MTREDAWTLAHFITLAMPEEDVARLKAMDVIPRLHKGMLTIRVYFKNSTAPDPEPYIFTAEEIL